MQFIRITLYNNSVPCIISTMKTNYVIYFTCKKIRNFPFTLVAPLGAH